MSIKRTIITTIAVLALVAVVAPVSVSAVTIDELMATINGLTAQLNALKAGTPAPVATGACAGVTFSRNLKVGSTGTDVKCLQVMLSVTPTSSYFGPKTLAAVKAYQTANGLTPANQVGPMTRAKLAASLTTGTTGTTGGTTGTITGPVSAAAAYDNPPASAIVGGQAAAALLNVNFTGNGTVTSVTLQRSGISDSSLFTAVYLFDGNTRITGGYSFNTNSTLTMNGLNIAVNGSKEISVRGDVLGGADACGTGKSVTNCESNAVITLTGFNGTSASVTGNNMTVASGSLATAQLTAYSATTATVNAGSTNQTLWSRTVSISPRAVNLNGLTVKMVGSAPSNTLANVALYVDGTQAGTAAINSNMQFVFTTNTSLTTGSHLVEVRGDVVAGSSRNFYLSLEQGSDISLKDSQLGVNITATIGASTIATNVNGDTITINGATGGSITLAQDSSFNNTTTLVGGATNVTMASFKFTAYGEDEKITDLKFVPHISGTAGSSATTLTNVGLYINGGQIGSNQTATDSNGTTNILEFSNMGSNLLIPAGTSVIVSIKGDVIASGGTAYTVGTVSFDVKSQSSESNAQGQSSMQLIGTSGQSGQSLAINSASAVNSFAGTTGFAAQSTSPNKAGAKIGSFTLQVGSAEGLTLRNVLVSLSGTLLDNKNITNLTVKNGSTVLGTPIGNPTGTNNFSVSVPVSVSSSVVLDVYGDIGSAADGQAITPSMQLTYQGATSNLTTVTDSDSITSGNQVTAGVATTVHLSAISASTGVTLVSSSSLSAQFVSGNSTSTLPIATFNVVATNAQGGAVIQNMTFTTVSSTIASVTVNGKTANITGDTGTIYNVGITVPSTYSGVNIPVTVQLVCVGSGCSGSSNANVQLTLASITYNNGSTVVSSGSLTNTPQSNALKLVASVPTIALTGSSANGLTTGVQKIGTFTVTAGSGGDIAFKAMPIKISASTSVTGISTVTLRDSSGNILTGVNTITDGLASSGANTFTFTTARPITAGQSETYTVYASVAASGGLGASGTSNVAFSLGDKASFTWNDVAGGTAGNNLSGSSIYSWPTDTQSKSN